MANIVCDCAGEMELNPFPCASTNYGYPVKILLMDTDGTLAVAGESPTLAEVQAGIAAAAPNKLIVIEEITNGQNPEASREEETGADTADGLTNTFGVNMAVTGKIKLLDEAIYAGLLKLNCHQRKKMWVIFSKGFIKGGKKGHITNAFIPPMSSGGFGTRVEIPINWVYQHNLNATDPAGQDDGFLTLTNPAVSQMQKLKQIKLKVWLKFLATLFVTPLILGVVIKILTIFFMLGFNLFGL